MHHISPENAQAAQKHAQIAKQHGESLEALAHELQQSTGGNPEEIQQILEQGRSIQAHAEASEKYAAIAEQDSEHSTEAYVLATHEHVVAAQEHVKAIREYLKIADEVLAEPEVSDSQPSPRGCSE